jgi:hypothetical protein
MKMILNPFFLILYQVICKLFPGRKPKFESKAKTKRKQAKATTKVGTRPITPPKNKKQVKMKTEPGDKKMTYSNKDSTMSLLSQIRSHLWKGSEYGNAAIMIGSGMSKNAAPVHPNVPSMPNWEQLTAGFAEALTPGSDELGRVSPLELAARYEARFGRVSLHNLLIRIVPDKVHTPSNLHKKLLNLPWADVFTTNYDTLLERTLSYLQPDRHYQVIKSVQSIAASSAPRIVKLHGSFPDTFPLIITDEDYRTYPVRFAPFVNMVQQSMMENIFCLIGFSGDDPNFIQWAGWVRDNLGENAPQIYLCGVYDREDSSRIEYLGARKVSIVDISVFLNPEDPDDTRSSVALERMLQFLEAGRPEDPLKWGSHPNISRSSVTTRKREYVEIMQILSSVRQKFPGWIVCPKKLRMEYWKETLDPAIQSVDWSELRDKPLDIKAGLLYEIVWGLDLCHYPLVGIIKTELELVVEEILQTTSAKKCNKLLFLTLCLLREYRYSFDADKYDGLWNRIDKHPSLSITSRENPGLQYERCLYYWYRLEYKIFNEHLQHWTDNSGDPFWKTRKASLFLMQGDLEQATAILQGSLADIRSNLNSSPSDVSLLSREAWTMYLLQYHFRKTLAGASSDMQGRWDYLARYHCDPFAELNIEYEFDGKAAEAEVTEKEEFDPGRVTVLTSLGTRRSRDQLLNILLPFRLRETAGCPLSYGSYSTCDDRMIKFLPQLLHYEPNVFLSACVQTHSNKFSGHLKRVDVASLDQEIVTWWNNRLMETVPFLIERLGASRGPIFETPPWENILGTALDLLSKLSIRGNQGDSKKLLNLICKLYTHNALRSTFQLFEPIDNVFRRVLESCSNDLISEQLPTLI